MKQADHRFRALHGRQAKWREGAATKLLTLSRTRAATRNGVPAPSPGNRPWHGGGLG